MDESHRLKPMVHHYDQKLFLDLFKKTEKLRKNLVREINPYRFGVDSDEVKSWFETKFIYAFNKYYNDPRCIDNRPEKLKAFIISSLQTYKLRIIKNSYQDKQKLHQTSDIDEIYNFENLLIDKPEDMNSPLLEDLKGYLKPRLSIDAWTLFNVELNPPPYILSRLADSKKIPKIPTTLLSEYLGTDESYIYNLKKEVNKILKQAKEYFNLIKSKKLVTS